MTTSLRDLQEALLQAFQRGERTPDDPGFRALAGLVAAGSARLRPEEQIDIYREQFFLRHLGCLEEDFPALQAALGHHAFDELSRAYLAAHPPTSFSLRDLGARLPAFLESAPVPLDPLPFHVDLARLEWALVDAFDAADLPPLDAALLQSTPPEAFDEAVLTLDPSLTLLELRYPVHEIHEAASGGQTFELPEPRRCCLGVYRRLDLALDWREIPPLAHRALGPLREGVPLAAALDQVAATLGDQGELEQLTSNIGAWFADWVQRGWIRGLTLPS